MDVVGPAVVKVLVHLLGALGRAVELLEDGVGYGEVVGVRFLHANSGI